MTPITPPSFKSEQELCGIEIYLFLQWVGNESIKLFVRSEIVSYFDMITLVFETRRCSTDNLSIS